MDSGKTIRNIFRDSGYDPDVLGRERMKRFASKCAAETYEYYMPVWNTAKSLKTHLIKNNQSIEFYTGGEVS